MVILTLVTILLASQIVHGTEGDPEWAKKSLNEIEMRDSMIDPFVSLGNEMNTPNFEQPPKHYRYFPPN